jgi:hypothetical protein
MRSGCSREERNLEQPGTDALVWLTAALPVPPAALPAAPPCHSHLAQKARWDHYLRWGVEYDCPIFHGLFKFCRQYAAASIGGCARSVGTCWAGMVVR